MRPVHSFPTAAIKQCDIGKSNPVSILWKKSIVAKLFPTVDCQLLCTKQRDAMNPSRSNNTSLGSASACNLGSFAFICPLVIQVFHFDR